MFASNRCAHLIAKFNGGVACQIPQTPHTKAVGLIVWIPVHSGVTKVQFPVPRTTAIAGRRPPPAVRANVPETSGTTVATPHTITTREPECSLLV